MRPLPLLLRRLSPSPLPLSRLIRPQYQPQPQRLLLLRTTSSAAAAATAPTETAAAPPPLATRELPASAQLRRLSAVPHRGQLRGLLCHMLPDNTLWNRAARERGVPVRLYRLAIRELIAHLSQTRGGDTADTGTAGRAANRGQDETARMLAPWTAEDDGAADDAAVPLTGGATAESHALRMAHHRPEDDDEEDGETLESAREAEQDDALADELLQLPNTVLSHAEMAALLREACGRPCTHNTYLEPNKRLPAMHRLHSRLVKRLKAYGHELQALHLEKHMPLLDKTQPQLPFLVARGYKRRFIIHRGPTNSGKTFGAMQQLLNAERGMFLAPLRLLAWEQHEKMLNHGIKADLTTGQERLISLDSTHLASTVEMADFSTDYDVAVIDECQILGDPQRGQSWTRYVECYYGFYWMFFFGS